MDTSHSKTIRQGTLHELAHITAIERGTLTEESGERAAPDAICSPKTGLRAGWRTRIPA